MAIKYYAGNKLTGIASDTKPTSNIIDGSTFFVTDTEDLFMYDLDTTAWKIVSGNTIAETLSNKTFSDQLTVAEGSAPSTPDSGFGALYIKSSDSKIYFKNDGGTEYNLTEGQSEGGESNQNAFSNIAVSGQTTVVADGETDTVTFAAGSNITITTTVGTDTVTFASSTVTVTDNESTAENNLITFVAGAGTNTGSHGIEMDGDFHYNPSTGTVTSTVFAGALTGNVTGDVSGTAATVTGAAQTAITSVGILTGLDLTSGDKTIFSTVGNNTLTIGASNTTVNIAGDLTVTGDATTFNTATVSVEDPLMILASNNNAADAVDIGFYGLYDTSGSLDLYSGLFRDASDSGKWKIFKDLQAAPTTVVDTGGTGYTAGTLVAALEGNATTATTLATARTIGGTSFNGSANIAVALSTAATALAATRTISASGDITWTSAAFDGSANVTSVAAITADVIINADVKSDAAIAYSKLAALADGNLLVGNGSNVATSVNPSGDVDVTNAGVFSIAAGVIVNADINASAAIVDTKLATIDTADKVAGGAIQIDSGTDGTGITIAATDKFLVDDGGATKYINASQILTYTSGSGASESFAIAMAVAL